MNILNSINHNSFYNKTPPPLITPFTFSINGGTNFSGSANNYPITFNPSSTTNTFGTVTNYSKSNFQNNSFTIYVKGKWQATNSTLIAFIETNYTTNNNLMHIATAGSIGKQINYEFRKNGVNYFQSANTAINTNQYFHSFIRFNYTTLKVSVYAYTYTTRVNLINTPVETTYPTGAFDNINICTFAHIIGNPTYCMNVTIGNAGWYNSVLSPIDMSNIVQQSPN